jgi:hypothetical protein
VYFVGIMPPDDHSEFTDTSLSSGSELITIMVNISCPDMFGVLPGLKATTTTVDGHQAQQYDSQLPGRVMGRTVVSAFGNYTYEFGVGAPPAKGHQALATFEQMLQTFHYAGG